MERTDEEEGERAARPYVRSVTRNPKEKEEKKLILRKGVSVWIDGANKKFPEKRDGVFFFFIQLTGPKAFYRPQQNRGRGLWICSTHGTGGLFALYRRRFAVYISLYL